MLNARKMSPEDVRHLVLKLAPGIPHEITLEDMVPELIRTTAAISGRITMLETSALVGAIAILARACAAGDPAATRSVIITPLSEKLQ